MGHREDLLAGAVRCLREKGYAHTTARDIVAASGTNLASIGYHYGSTKALLNAAVLKAMDEFGEQMAQAIGDRTTARPPLERFERFWERVIDSFRTSIRCGWPRSTSSRWRSATPTCAPRWPTASRTPGALGADAVRRRSADDRQARAVGSLHQGLVSGVLVQWLIDPDRAPSPADLAHAMKAIADRITG